MVVREYLGIWVWVGKEMIGGKFFEKKKGRLKMIGKDYNIF